MQRYSVIACVLVVFAMAVPLTHAQQDQRLVFINLDRVFNEFYKTKQADAQLKEQAEEFNTERAKLVEEYEAMNTKFTAARDEAQNTAFSEEVRNTKRNEAEELLIDMREFETRIQRFDQSRRKQLEDQGRRMRSRIVDEIKDVVQTYARAQGFLAVIDSSGQSMNAVEIILYVDTRIEITDAVLDLLNKGR